MSVWPTQVKSILRKLGEVERRLQDQFVERDDTIRLLVLAAVCREHLLLLGPPGVGKTRLAMRFAGLINARKFEHQLTRFSEPSEIFGPLDIGRFREGDFHISTEGMLADVEIGFLDEVFEANSAVLNTLLTLMSDSRFTNGREVVDVPLMMLIGASNAAPEESTLAAFADRFVLRADLAPVSEGALGALFEAGWQSVRERIRGDQSITPIVTVEEIAALSRRLLEVDVKQVRPIYETVARRCRGASLAISDRRLVLGLKLVAGSALLADRTLAEPQDLWPIRHLWVRRGDRNPLNEIVSDALGEEFSERHIAPPTSEELQAELDGLYRDESALRSEAAIFQHLTALGRLRNAAARYCEREANLRDEIEVAVERIHKRLQEVE